MGLLVDQLDGPPGAGVSGGLPGIVLPAPAAQIGGDARVERTIGAAEYVDEPQINGCLMHSFALHQGIFPRQAHLSRPVRQGEAALG
jgi:hypothetical protein